MSTSDISAFLVKADHYYGRRSPGWVAVIGGQPWHFTGRTGKKDATAAVEKVTEKAREKQNEHAKNALLAGTEDYRTELPSA